MEKIFLQTCWVMNGHLTYTHVLSSIKKIKLNKEKSGPMIWKDRSARITYKGEECRKRNEHYLKIIN